MFGNLRTLGSLNKVISFQKKFRRNKFKLIYCPPATLLSPLSDKLKSTSIEVGAQNCHESHNYGANTGQINSNMIKAVGAKYVILGHSENRKLGENDSLINLKIKSSLKSGLKIIFCIGETLSQKRKKMTKKILLNQLNKGLYKIKKKENILIAYEPVWSIGTGLVPKSEDLNHVISFIKIFLRNKMKFKNPKVLYGGSVSPQNISLLRKVLNLDGFLVGGSSQNSKKFIDIIKKTFI